MKNFKLWLEDSNDIFGFEAEFAKDNPVVVKRPDEKPIQQFGTGYLLDRLLTFKLGEISPTQPQYNEIKWGKNGGAIRISIKPKYNTEIERCIVDLEGTPIWILKRLVRVNIEEYAGREESVASDLFNIASEIYKQPLDIPKREYPQLEELTRKIVFGIRNKSGDLFKFENIKKVSPTNFLISMSLKGSGLGQSFNILRRSGIIASGIVNISFNKYTGLIRIIVTMVDLDGEGVSWYLDPSNFDSYFAPSQSEDEIVSAVITSLKYY